jgi:hypothetical protein
VVVGVVVSGVVVIITIVIMGLIIITTITDHGHVQALPPPVAVVVTVVEVAVVDVNIVIVDRMIDMGVEGVEVRDGVDVA